MKSTIDIVTGVLFLIPESEPDRRLIYHICNCSDMNHFTEYLETCENQPITEEIGIEVAQFTGYLEAKQPVSTQPLKLGSRNRSIMIGFNRE